MSVVVEEIVAIGERIWGDGLIVAGIDKICASKILVWACPKVSDRYEGRSRSVVWEW